MFSDRDQKTEAPTPRRRSQARQSGNVSKSADLPAAILLLAGLIMLRILGPSIFGKMRNILIAAFAQDEFIKQGSLVTFAAAAAREVMWMVAPFMAVMVVVTLIVMYAQVGLLWTTKPLMPNLEKLNPITGIGRMFSGKTVATALINVAKMTAVVAIAFLVLRTMTGKILFSLALEHAAILAVAAQLVFDLGIYLACVLIVLALIDYTYQRYRHERDLKMTKEEVKDEVRSMEGDRQIKARQQAVQLQMVKQSLGQEVPKADVVITNPTHVSVALKYDLDKDAAPKVTAKGADYMALHIRQLAVAAGVPIVERPPLARMLYADCDVGEEIPERFYRAVADILNYVYQLSGKNLKPRPVPVGAE